MIFEYIVKVEQAESGFARINMQVACRVIALFSVVQAT